jgi:aromatic-L-amino-acid decarboxylase
VTAAAGAGGLDPEDWDDFRRVARQALDDMTTFVATVRERPVWVEAPAEVRAHFAQDLPHAERSLDAVLADFDRLIKPYATGNLHPAFMGWVHGAGTPVGMVAEMLAAGLNANCGGRNHIGIVVEQQITRWMREAFRFPDTASGVFVTGTSMANLLGLLVGRNRAVGDDIRHRGLKGVPQLCAYASAAAHGCIRQAVEMAGIGSDHLRRIPIDQAGRMDVGALAAAVAADRAAGLAPFFVVGTAGTVDIGAIDPLAAIADLAEREGLSFHVDGAFGAMGVLSPALRPRLEGLERADSIAFDFHKWLHVPYDAGFLLVRDGDAHRRTFAAQNAYLTRSETGLAAGDIWPCDLGPDLSRGFRALKTWFTLQVFGADRLGAAMTASCDLARRLAGAIAASPHFDLVAPVDLNIVCLSARSPDADGANRRIVDYLHRTGQAAPSITLLAGKAVIRCAINNHRTAADDIDALVIALHEALPTVDTAERRAVRQL